MHPTSEFVFCDGGLVKKNPSPFGGTWAYRIVAGGRVVEQHSGSYTCEEMGLKEIGNNLSELYAILVAFRGLPDGWSGVICSDSLNALGRISDKKSRKITKVPDDILGEIQRHRRRLGAYKIAHVYGHPRKKELRTGGKPGRRFSRHNVWCDDACRSEAAAFAESRSIT